MLLQRFYDDGLAQASYLIGCHATGEAIVVDPNRDVDQYVAAAEREGLRLTHVTETHIHADFVSGARELAQRTGAALFLSTEGGPDWQYAFAAEAGATLVKDGDTIRVGNVVLTVMHTPGHTPGSLCFRIHDALFSGDTLFLQGCGRVDLPGGDPDEMYRTLNERLSTLPGDLMLYPGHAYGGKAARLDQVRATNPYLQVHSLAAFRRGMGF